MRQAFLKSLPVMCGYIFLGIAFGIVLENAGYNFLWALAISVFVYAGSMQFVLVPLLVSAASPITMAITTFFVNSRHLFYGLSFIESFGKMKTRPYMIFSLTDETYSVLCGWKNEDPEETQRGYWFWLSLMDHSYWIIGSVIGAILGHVLPIDFTGIDFAMTALFVVILTEQVLSNPKKTRFAAATGLIVGAICLFVLGSANFLLPALLITVFLVSVKSEVAGRKINDEKGENA